MNKWIAEFDLEDGDTMPEHMDLEYKGARIDFHCRPLEQEPTTKNDLGVDLVSRAEVLKLMKDNWHTHDGNWAMQESMDDIRALPSVYPKSDKPILCKDCRHNGSFDTDCPIKWDKKDDDFCSFAET